MAMTTKEAEDASEECFHKHIHFKRLPCQRSGYAIGICALQREIDICLVAPITAPKIAKDEQRTNEQSKSVKCEILLGILSPS